MKDTAEIGTEILHVFDLPQLYTKPDAAALLHALDLLKIAPPSWDQSEATRSGFDVRPACQPAVAPEGVPKYLTSIVSSSLRWLQDDGEKEQIWEQASLRLSERSGRTGMSAMTRDFAIPCSSGDFTIKIHEPALTSDNLGLKTWAASYLLAKRLGSFDLKIAEDEKILELGSGTGLVGIAAAHILRAPIVLTDLPEIVPNLQSNAQLNVKSIEAWKGGVETAVLDWSEPRALQLESTAVMPTCFPIILAADSIYGPDHPAMLVRTIKVWLSPSAEARVIVEFPLRDCYAPQLSDFRQRMENIGLYIIDQGEEIGYDDWVSGIDDRPAEVECWWSIWGWKSP